MPNRIREYEASHLLTEISSLEISNLEIIGQKYFLSSLKTIFRMFGDHSSSRRGWRADSRA